MGSRVSKVALTVLVSVSNPAVSVSKAERIQSGNVLLFENPSEDVICGGSESSENEECIVICNQSGVCQNLHFIFTDWVKVIVHCIADNACVNARITGNVTEIDLELSGRFSASRMITHLTLMAGDEYASRVRCYNTYACSHQSWYLRSQSFNHALLMDGELIEEHYSLITHAGSMSILCESALSCVSINVDASSMKSMIVDCDALYSCRQIYAYLPLVKDPGMDIPSSVKCGSQHSCEYIHLFVMNGLRVSLEPSFTAQNIGSVILHCGLSFQHTCSLNQPGCVCVIPFHFNHHTQGLILIQFINGNTHTSLDPHLLLTTDNPNKQLMIIQSNTQDHSIHSLDCLSDIQQCLITGITFNHDSSFPNLINTQLFITNEQDHNEEHVIESVKISGVKLQNVHIHAQSVSMIPDNISIDCSIPDYCQNTIMDNNDHFIVYPVYLHLINQDCVINGSVITTNQQRQWNCQPTQNGSEDIISSMPPIQNSESSEEKSEWMSSTVIMNQSWFVVSSTEMSTNHNQSQQWQSEPVTHFGWMVWSVLFISAVLLCSSICLCLYCLMDRILSKQERNKHQTVVFMRDGKSHVCYSSQSLQRYRHSEGESSQPPTTSCKCNISMCEPCLNCLNVSMNCTFGNQSSDRRRGSTAEFLQSIWNLGQKCESDNSSEDSLDAIIDGRPPHRPIIAADIAEHRLQCGEHVIFNDGVPKLVSHAAMSFNHPSHYHNYDAQLRRQITPLITQDGVLKHSQMKRMVYNSHFCPIHRSGDIHHAIITAHRRRSMDSECNCVAEYVSDPSKYGECGSHMTSVDECLSTHKDEYESKQAILSLDDGKSEEDCTTGGVSSVPSLPEYLDHLETGSVEDKQSTASPKCKPGEPSPIRSNGLRHLSHQSSSLHIGREARTPSSSLSDTSDTDLNHTHTHSTTIIRLTPLIDQSNK